MIIAVNKMNERECRIWIAQTRWGWEKATDPHWLDANMPPTLDSAADAMPPGWGFEISMSNWWTDVSGAGNHLKRVMYQATGHQMTEDYDEEGEVIVLEPAHTELEARWRLAVACIAKYAGLENLISDITW